EHIRWPDGKGCAVSLTFNYQGAEGLKAGANGRVNHEQYAEREYGTNVGIWRILRLLRKHDVRATFLVCGSLAEHFPDTVRAIAEDGHEIAGHGYHHEVATDMAPEEELEIIRSTTEILRQVAGVDITGWRSCDQSPNTPELVLREGLRWNG